MRNHPAFKSQKQIEVVRRLRNVKAVSELSKFHHDVQAQNNNLRTQVEQLKHRIEQLKQNNNINAIYQHQIAKQSQLKQLKNQITVKVQSMKSLKKQIKQIQPINNNHTHPQIVFQNHIKSLETIINQQKTKINDLKKQQAKLQSTYQQCQNQNKVTDPQIQSLEKQNNQLRKKIKNLRKFSQQKLYQSVKVQENLIKIKNQFQKNQKLALSQLKEKSFADKRQLLQIQSRLQSQVSKLKDQIKTFQQQKLKKNIEIKYRKDNIDTSYQSLISKMKSLQQTKLKRQQQMNKYNKIWNDISQRKSNKQAKKQFVDKQTQITQQKNCSQLHRQFGGVLGKNQFNDRQILMNEKQTFIIGLTIYQNQKGLSAVKAHYSNKLSSNLPIPNQYLNKKCKITQLQVHNQDFIKLFKIKFNKNQNRVIKIEAISNKNLRYQFGQRRAFSELLPDEVVYGFDIWANQYPVCIFGSIIFNKNNWYLESFGTQINQLKNIQ